MGITSTDLPGAADLAEDKPTKVENLRQALALFVRHPSPWLIVVSASIGWAGKVFVGGWTWWDLAIGAGIALLWPLQEWLVHVFVLHFKPRKFFGRKIDMHVAYKHRVHHKMPWVVDHVYVPWRTLVFGIPIFVALWMLVLPFSMAFTLIAVYFSFGILYEWTHFLIHTGYKPRTEFFRKRWKNHRLHHFKNEHYWYGVSRLAGDYILRTAPEPGDVEKSETCRSIVDPDELDL